MENWSASLKFLCFRSCVWEELPAPQLKVFKSHCHLGVNCFKAEARDVYGEYLACTVFVLSRSRSWDLGMTAGVLDSNLLHKNFQAIEINPLEMMLTVWKKRADQRAFCGKVVFST